MNQTKSLRTDSAQNRSAVANKDSGHRIGFYIRVSTEEQAENPEGSIKNQEERLKAALSLKKMERPGFGELSGTFTDRARSGKDMDRPELQRLLLAIRRNEIDLVMVSELSRLSRSIKDFSEIWELMKRQGCQFLSLRENFDTDHGRRRKKWFSTRLPISLSSSANKSASVFMRTFRLAPHAASITAALFRLAIS